MQLLCISWSNHVCDMSFCAIIMVREHEFHDQKRCKAWQAQPEKHIRKGQLQSSIHPWAWLASKHQNAEHRTAKIAQAHYERLQKLLMYILASNAQNMPLVSLLLLTDAVDLLGF